MIVSLVAQDVHRISIRRSPTLFRTHRSHLLRQRKYAPFPARTPS